MIIIPKKNYNTVLYTEKFAKTINQVIIINDQESSNVSDLFIVWNQKCKVFISSELTDFYEFLNHNKISENKNILIIGTKKVPYRLIEEYKNLLTFYFFYQKEYKKILKQIIKDNNKAFKEKTKENKIINTLSLMMKDLNSGGKLLRAVLISLGYKIGANNNDDYLKLSSIYELFQTSILIHDDIIDGASTRRKKETINSRIDLKYKEYSQTLGNSLALCMGDLGYYYVNKELLYYKNHPNFLKIYDYFNDVVIKTIKGEILDTSLSVLNKNNLSKLTKEEVLEIAYLKTANYSIIGPVILGMLLAQDSEANLKKVEKSLKAAGMAFQIKDDILGIFGSDSEIGKTSTDISEFKITLLYYNVINTKYKSDFLNIYGKKTVTKKDQKEIRKILIDSKALAKTELEMNNLFDESYNSIYKNKAIPKMVKEILLGFISFLKVRDK